MGVGYQQTELAFCHLYLWIRLAMVERHSVP